MAAERGYDFACCKLGLWFAEGRHDLMINISKAKHFLEKGTSGSCTYNHCTLMLKAQALSKLEEMYDLDM
eukprot:scaffold408107_cov82-Attheya_sp.AAC.1